MTESDSVGLSGGKMVHRVIDANDEKPLKFEVVLPKTKTRSQTQEAGLMVGLAF